MDVKDLKKQLAKPVPREYMSERTGAGNQTLHYVAGDYVIHTLNEIFGPENVSTHIDEVRTIVNRTVKRQVNLGSKKTANGYEPLGTKEVEYLEVQYMVRGRIEIQVGDKTIVKSGIGTGKGSGWAAEDKLIAQVHEVAIKGAETDMVKRSAKKLGPIFGLSIGDDGKQLYASVAEDEAQPTEETGEAAKPDDAKPEAAKPEAAKAEPAKAEAAKTAPATAAPATPKVDAKPAAAATSKPASPAAAASTTPSAAATPAPTPAPAAPAPVTPPPAATPAATPAPAAAATAEIPASVRLNPTTAPAAANGAIAAPATGTGRIELPHMDIEALKALDSNGWVNKMKQLKGVLETTRSVEDVIAIAHHTGRYERLINDNPRVDEGFKTQVHDLMVRYINAHMTSHNIPIDIEAQIAATRDEKPAGAADFDVPF